MKQKLLLVLLLGFSILLFGTMGCEPDYETVTIGTQVWMKHNLNIETGNSWC